MKKFFLLITSILFLTYHNGQSLKPIPEKVEQVKTAGKNFSEYDLFKSIPGQGTKYANAADDITVMLINQNELKRLVAESPDAVEMSFPFEDKLITLELVKNNFLTHDFKVNSDKGIQNYSPGTYYFGTAKGSHESIAAISFFNDELIGMVSLKNVGNINLGKIKGTTEYVSYNDAKLKGINKFSCRADALPENKNVAMPYDSKMKQVKGTDNCVRIYYEVGFNIYKSQGYNTTTTANWVTAMQNNVSTLYANDGVNVALSEIFVWTTMEPYDGNPDNPVAALTNFKDMRPAFNGDVAQYLRTPAGASVAWINSLCDPNRYSVAAVELQFEQVPTYSWNIEAMTHEIGHNLGSPHTHACFWNGDFTAIDGCGPAIGATEGCDASLPTNSGTIMSYCHLVPSVGIIFANGFGEQPAALIRNTVNSKGCLGTDCVASCPVTVTVVTVNSITKSEAKATIFDNSTTNSWSYRLTKLDGTFVTQGVAQNKTISFTGLEKGTYYIVSVGMRCTGPNAFSVSRIFLTDDDWCGGAAFTDTGGENGDYAFGESVTKTFYPLVTGDKLKLVFTQFDTNEYDLMTVYNGTNTASQPFSNGVDLSGNTVPGPFISTHSSGAITVKFISVPRSWWNTKTRAGWKSHFECQNLEAENITHKDDLKIVLTDAIGIYHVISKNNIIGVEIFEMSGKLIYKSKTLNKQREIINISKNPAGIYLFSVQTDKRKFNIKVNKR